MADDMVQVRMLLDLGGHSEGDLVEVAADEVDAYVAAGYVERVA